MPDSVTQILKSGPPGTKLNIRVADGAVILEPISGGALDRLTGRFAGIDFLTDLEAEHRHEVEHDREARA